MKHGFQIIQGDLNVKLQSKLFLLCSPAIATIAFVKG